MMLFDENNYYKLISEEFYNSFLSVSNKKYLYHYIEVFYKDNSEIKKYMLLFI